MAHQLLPRGIPRGAERSLRNGQGGPDLSGEGDVLPLQDAQVVPRGHDDQRRVHAEQCGDAELRVYRDALYDTLYAVVQVEQEVDRGMKERGTGENCDADKIN